MPLDINQKSIGNLVAISMKYQCKSIGNPVYSLRKTRNWKPKIGNSNGHLKNQWKSIANPVEISME